MKKRHLIPSISLIEKLQPMIEEYRFFACQCEDSADAYYNSWRTFSGYKYHKTEFVEINHLMTT